MGKNQHLNPGLVGDLFWGIFRPQWIRLALTLDIFTPLAAAPASAEQVAQACQSDAFAIGALLDYFCGVNILERRGDLYALTPNAETFLMRGRKAYAGDMILDYTSPALFESILNSIRTGKPHALNDNFAQDAWLESYSTWRIPKNLEMWRAAGIQPDDVLPFRILDTACGCAIKSFALAQTSPNAHVTCLDSPAVLDVARDLAERMAVLPQAAFLPADLRTADLGTEHFDAPLLGQITHYLTVEQNQNLFQRIYTALKRDGTLVVDCPMAGAAPSESASFLTLFLWANGGGTAYAFETYCGWLNEAGFQRVGALSERWLSAKKNRENDGGRDVLTKGLVFGCRGPQPPKTTANSATVKVIGPLRALPSGQLDAHRGQTPIALNDGHHLHQVPNLRVISNLGGARDQMHLHIFQAALVERVGDEHRAFVRGAGHLYRRALTTTATFPPLKARKASRSFVAPSSV